ncbi:DUF1876 domain-containing protein [Streptomyces sp. CMB-StM0423]|uniref:DUF1876 domain-containing protein n=1 Tax=unclassified Streptomyces TaxID=2593676 RepID=UPI000C70AE0F|nr:DUF1876 domain-containing protein [Streptomyces sp. CMB-StM0423]AUH39597.1 DUF1876 domain-containing protein [Streptomyces sp. CMB-StM0423]
MTHSVKWNVGLHLFEEAGTTRARVVLDTSTGRFTGHGDAHRNPADPDVPEIGDELAAGRALDDLGRQLVDVARRDVEAVEASGRDARPGDGWPSPDRM